MCRLIGKVLLKSPQGERVREIQVLHENGGRVAILRDIFQTWLMEDEEATWEKLVTHLISAGLSPLAQAIQSRFRKTFITIPDYCVVFSAGEY